MRAIIAIAMDPDALVFRLATPVDADALVALVTSAFSGDSARAGWTHEADLLGGRRTDAAEVRALVSGDASAVLLGERDGAAVACCHLALRDGAGYVSMFAVRPDLQGRGLGSRLLAEVERRLARDFACRDARMLVIHLRAELIAWYGRRGWTPSGETAPFPAHDPRFGVPKRADLRFAVLTKRLANQGPQDAEAADGRGRLTHP